MMMILMLNETGQTKAVTALGNASTLQGVQTNGANVATGIVPLLLLFQRHQVFDNSHRLPRNGFVGSTKGKVRMMILIVG